MKRYIALICSLLLLLTLLQAVPVAAAPGQEYIVRPGDTLTNIAAYYGISVSQLAAANGLAWNSWLYVGQRLSIPGALVAAPAPSGTGGYTVKPGDTLFSIAVRHSLSASELATANGLYWNSWVYVGQRLVIPGQQAAPAPVATPTTNGTYVVQPGNTLFSIARWHGTSVGALQTANGLRSNLIYVGQRLVIPGSAAAPAQPAAPQPTPPPVHGTSGEKWIDINLTAQHVTAYEGQTVVYSAPASTGTWRTPTVVGTYKIYSKYAATHMSGPGYSLPNVPFTMYFFKGYAIHGTYWHNNFGTPMSHGCVNLPTPDAEWFYNWAPIGTKVVTHY